MQGASGTKPASSRGRLRPANDKKVSMKQVNTFRAILGGFIGTFVMTVLLYLAPWAGAPKTDIAALLGSLFGHGVPSMMTGLWWAGMVWHFLNGTIVFSLIYAYFVYQWLPGENWL